MMSPKFLPLVPFILVLCHFAFDWVYQSHREAMLKSKDYRVRLWHCLKYTVPFEPVLLWMGMSALQMAASLLILFTTHFIIDTYIPVLLWAKYLRKAPQFAHVGEPVKRGPWQDKVVEPVHYANDVDAFRAFAQTPLGLVLMITMDQFLHILCLLPVAMLAMH